MIDREIAPQPSAICHLPDKGCNRSGLSFGALTCGPTLSALHFNLTNLIGEGEADKLSSLPTQHSGLSGVGVGSDQVSEMPAYNAPAATYRDLSRALPQS